MNEQEMKVWIDGASYHDLLLKWRYAPFGDPFFCGAVGEYYDKKIAEKRAALSHEAQVAASKAVG